MTIGITVNVMLNNFLSSRARSKYLSLFSLSLIFTLWFAGTVKSIIRQVLFYFFLLRITRSGRLAGIRWSVSILKSQRILSVSFSRTDSGLCIYHLFVWWNFNFLHSSQWITITTHPCLVLYTGRLYLWRMKT